MNISKYKAKAGLFKGSSGVVKSFGFGNFTSPLLDEIKDPSELQYTFNRFPIVPFFGNNEDSSDSILNAMYRLSEITPVFGGLLESIGQFTLNAGFKLHKQEGLGILSRKTVEVSDAEFTAYEQRLQTELVNTDLTEVAQKACNTYLIDGNIFLKVAISKTTKTFSIQALNTTQVRYMEEMIPNYKEVMLSATFLSTAILTQQPEIIPVFPNYVESDGLVEFVIHVKKSVPNRHYYGLSRAFNSIMNNYLLNQLLVYLSAETDNRFTGKVMIDAEASSNDTEDGLSEGTEAFIEYIKNTFTNKGTERSTVLARFREPDTAEAKVTQFNANTEENFYQTIFNLINEQVVVSMGWDKRLIGYSRENGLGGNDLDTIFRLSSQKVVGVQEAVTKSINNALFAIDSVLNIGYYKDYQIRLGNLFNKMVEETKEADSEINIDNGTNNAS